MRVEALAQTTRKRSSRVAVVAGALAIWFGSGATAEAYCRTSTCPLVAGTGPTTESCDPDGYVASCTNAMPVWWRNACVSYDIQKDASRQITYAQASQAIAAAFSKWTGAICANGDERASIDVRDLGPVECDQVQYNSNQGNQHVIIFHDDTWPYNDSSNTLGLTTVTFDPDTGEIYDADMEINSTAPIALYVGDAVPEGGYDFESIVTHEAGHFLGMAHSGEISATMFAHYVPGTMTMRILTADDVAGICSIYPPNGTRAVDPSVDNGQVTEAACDPTPRHGFQSVCAQPQSSCGTAPGGPRTPGTTTAFFGLLAVASAARRLRRAASSGTRPAPAT